MKAACLIPCYNESQRLDVDRYRRLVLANSNIDFYLLNDGSTDNTLYVLNQVSQGNSNVHVKDFTPNQGKAGVIRAGMLELVDSDYAYVGFLDADFATPFEEFKRLLEIVETEGYDIIFGSRVKLKGWQIERNPIRHWFSRIVLTIIDTLFKLEIYDTQCGCKIFKREVIQLCFEEKFVTKWLFDIEIFIRYLRNSSKIYIKEIPLNRWKEIKGSKLKIGDFLQVPLNIFQLYRRYGRV
jgi:glycosyltransferase involved in cell wall biosynthesis